MQRQRAVEAVRVVRFWISFEGVITGRVWGVKESWRPRCLQSFHLSHWKGAVAISWDEKAGGEAGFWGV